MLTKEEMSDWSGKKVQQVRRAMSYRWDYQLCDAFTKQMEVVLDTAD